MAVSDAELEARIEFLKSQTIGRRLTDEEILESDKRDGYLITAEKLEDIPLPNTAYGLPMDKNITNLVLALRGLGLKTAGSCEGHFSKEHHRYPWVTLSSFNVSKFHELSGIFDNYNKTNGVKWCIDDHGQIQCVRPYLSAKNKKELGYLQQSSDQLAYFVFDNYVRGKTINLRGIRSGDN